MVARGGEWGGILGGGNSKSKGAGHREAEGGQPGLQHQGCSGQTRAEAGWVRGTRPEGKAPATSPSDLPTWLPLKACPLFGACFSVTYSSRPRLDKSPANTLSPPSLSAALLTPTGIGGLSVGFGVTVFPAPPESKLSHSPSA